MKKISLFLLLLTFASCSPVIAQDTVRRVSMASYTKNKQLGDSDRMLGLYDSAGTLITRLFPGYTFKNYVDSNGNSISFVDTNTLILTSYAATLAYWGTIGNSGISYSNYIGTLDTAPIQIRQNNIQAGFIDGIKYHNTFLGVLTPRAYGQHNTGFGTAVLTNLTSGKQNTGVGASALTNVITGNNNTAIGYNSGELSQGSGNTNVGAYAGILDNYSHNTWIGDSANPATAFTTAGYDIAIGFHVMTTGSSQVMLGNPIFDTATHLCGQISIDTNNAGVRAFNYGLPGYVLTSQGKGHPNVWRDPGGGGGSSWLTNGNTTPSGQSAYSQYWGCNDTTFGLQAIIGQRRSLWIDTGGTTYIGYQAGEADPLQQENVNTGIGEQALQNLNGGQGNVAIGPQPLLNNTTGSFNTAFGYQSGFNNITGSNNIFIGVKSGSAEYSLSNQCYIGDSIGQGKLIAVKFSGALMPYYDSSGHPNYHCGQSGQVLTSQGGSVSPQWMAPSGWDLEGNSGTTPSTNFIGTTDNESLVFKIFNTPSGLLDVNNNNTVFGYSAFINNVSGNNNAIFGEGAFLESSTGSFNTAIGTISMSNCLTASYNTAVGYNSLGGNGTGAFSSCAALGYEALQNNTANANTAVGDSAMWSNSLGINNTSIGYSAEAFNINGSCNTAIGNAAGYNDVGSFNTFIGDTTIVNSGTVFNSTALGYGTVINGSNEMDFGNSSVSTIQGQVLFTIYSDRRIKDNIKPVTHGLDLITKLIPITYNLNIHRQDSIQGTDSASVKDKSRYKLVLNKYTKRTDTIYAIKRIKDPSKHLADHKFDIEKNTQIGFIAQQVDSAAQSVGWMNYPGVSRAKDSKDLNKLQYDALIPVLVKAIQEQQIEIDSLKTKLNGK